ncbi:MAG TPA: alpha/beta fold hydrolase [Candidatus Limnocylindrales bacterium]|nr:alpha/beta fold hydrolase [Candidatus Limnocylindrales bacterium]
MAGARQAKEYVLVHGAAHGAWCWEAVAARLTRRGHRVTTLDMPGHGRRAAEVGKASVAAYAQAVVDAMAQAGVSRGIVVGHSMAGVVIPRVAELVPSRVAHLVFLAAIVVPHGGSIAEANASPAARAALHGLATGRGDGTFLYPAETAWARWMADLPRDSPEAGRALALLTPQALRPFIEKVDMRGFYALRVPRSYIRCMRDAAVTPDRAAGYAARLGVTPIDIRTAHDPMLSDPDGLAERLDRIAS